MNSRRNLPGAEFLATGQNWLAHSSSRIERAFRTCENPSCTRRRGFWNALFRNDSGIRLQGQWYCSPECFEAAAQFAFSSMLPAAEEIPPRRHRVPIGLLLLSRGTINDNQLKHALRLQREEGGGKIGKILQEIHAASEKDITEGLAAQWGCPVYPLGRAREFLHCATLMPLTLARGRTHASGALFAPPADVVHCICGRCGSDGALCGRANAARCARFLASFRSPIFPVRSPRCALLSELLPRCSKAPANRSKWLEPPAATPGN